MAKPRLIVPDREQVVLNASAIDDLVDARHIVRDVWDFVGRLDLSALRDAVGSREGTAGAPAFDPRTLLALWVYATIDGVGSARRLSDLVDRHSVYRWIAGGVSINYHTLASFRSANGEALDRLLASSVATMAEEGLIDRDKMTVAHDGMRVRASAGAGSMRSRPALERLLEEAKARVAELKEKPVEGAAQPTKRKAAARERAARERAERIGEAMRVLEEIESRTEVHEERGERAPRASTTDPEATSMRMADGGKRVGHNVQFTVDAASRAIVHARVAPRGSDTGTLAPALGELAAGLGRYPSRVFADGGFVKFADVAEIERAGCEVFMPDPYAGFKWGDRRRKADLPRLEAWRERMLRDESRELYKARASTVEWANAMARQQGLTELTVRGRGKVRAVALLHALAHNARRWIALVLRPRRLAEQLA